MFWLSDLLTSAWFAYFRCQWQSMCMLMDRLAVVVASLRWINSKYFLSTSHLQRNLQLRPRRRAFFRRSKQKILQLDTKCSHSIRFPFHQNPSSCFFSCCIYRTHHKYEIEINISHQSRVFVCFVCVKYVFTIKIRLDVAAILQCIIHAWAQYPSNFHRMHYSTKNASIRKKCSINISLLSFLRCDIFRHNFLDQ